jgi:hypothetical protein
MASTTVDESLFEHAVSILIPLTDGMPAVDEVRLATDRLAAVLATRPDIADDLARAVAACSSATTLDDVRRALQTDAPAWGALTLAAAAAYFLSPYVLARLDYRPPSRRWELGELEKDALDLLTAVRARPPRYPADAAAG